MLYEPEARAILAPENGRLLFSPFFPWWVWLDRGVCGYAEFDLPSGKISTFLEVDLGHESLAVLKKKADRYLDLAISGEYERLFHQKYFRVLVLAHSDQRARSIRTAVSQVTKKLFWFGSLANATSDGLVSPIWRREEGTPPEPFLSVTP
jgi:hypothetical protein